MELSPHNAFGQPSPHNSDESCLLERLRILCKELPSLLESIHWTEVSNIFADDQYLAIIIGNLLSQRSHIRHRCTEFLRRTNHEDDEALV